MAQFRACNLCGSNIDPGERCSCLDPEQEERLDRAVAEELQRERDPKHIIAENKAGAEFLRLLADKGIIAV